jgi:magnesium transporter
MIAHVYARDARRNGAGVAVLRDLWSGAGTPIVDAAAHELLWVDLANPDDQDIEWLSGTFGFHQLALEDVARRHQRAKIEEFPGYAFTVLYAARTDAPARRITTSELQFFWGERYLVTIHSDPFPEIDEIAARARSGAQSSLGSGKSRHVQVADLVYRLVDAIVDGYFPAVDMFADWSEDIEEEMFAETRKSRRSLQEIFRLKKDVFHLRKVVAPSREVLNQLLRRDHGLFGDEYYPYFQDVYDHTVRVIDSLDTYRDLLSAVLDTYLSIVSNDVSQTVKKMTAVTAILMVNGLIAGIYGMNFDVMPELHWHFGYAWAMGLMVVLSVGLWSWFRRIEWL